MSPVYWLAWLLGPWFEQRYLAHKWAMEHDNQAPVWLIIQSAEKVGSCLPVLRAAQRACSSEHINLKIAVTAMRSKHCHKLAI